MTILALDQASRTSGYAVFCDDQLIDSGKFTFDEVEWITLENKERLEELMIWQRD